MSIIQLLSILSTKQVFNEQEPQERITDPGKVSPLSIDILLPSLNKEYPIFSNSNEMTEK
jgi:hypothetical protein